MRGNGDGGSAIGLGAGVPTGVLGGLVASWLSVVMAPSSRKETYCFIGLLPSPWKLLSHRRRRIKIVARQTRQVVVAEPPRREVGSGRLPAIRWHGFAKRLPQGQESPMPHRSILFSFL